MRLCFNIIVCIMIIGINACGFQLRGSNLEALQNSSVFVNSVGADQIAREVRIQLQNADITPVGSASDAEYIINLSEEYYDRKVLSVSPQTGKVEEYELSYSAKMTIRKKNGEVLVNSEALTAERDYTFDEGSVLGTFTQESVLERDIAKQAAAAVLRRLQAVTR